MNNGGFHQYFFNSAGDNCHEALRALRLLGATVHAGLLEKAMARFGPRGPSRDRDERWAQMDAWNEADDDALGALDREWYNAESLYRLEESLCREHADEFRRPPR